MGISGLNFYGKSFKGSRYIIRKNKKITRGPKNKKFTRGPKNKLYEYYPKSTGISGLDFYGRTFKRSRYITRTRSSYTKGRKLPKLIQISKKDHSNDVYKTSKMIEKCRLCLTKLDPIRFTIHPTAMIMKTTCVCGLSIVIRPDDQLGQGYQKADTDRA